MHHVDPFHTESTRPTNCNRYLVGSSVQQKLTSSELWEKWNVSESRHLGRKQDTGFVPVTGGVAKNSDGSAVSLNLPIYLYCCIYCCKLNVLLI